jgi:hypothetical protein
MSGKCVVCGGYTTVMPVCWDPKCELTLESRYTD